MRFRPIEEAELWNEFRSERYPSKWTVRQIARRLNIEPRDVIDWFRYKRYRIRKELERRQKFQPSPVFTASDLRELQEEVELRRQNPYMNVFLRVQRTRALARCLKLKTKDVRNRLLLKWL